MRCSQILNALPDDVTNDRTTKHYSALTKCPSAKNACIYRACCACLLWMLTDRQLCCGVRRVELTTQMAARLTAEPAAQLAARSPFPGCRNRIPSRLRLLKCDGSFSGLPTRLPKRRIAVEENWWRIVSAFSPLFYAVLYKAFGM